MYEAWSTNGWSETDNAENLVALYLFGERSGSVVYNQVAEGPDLYIPPTFRIPCHSFLRMPWKEFETDGVDWQDVGINIAGFIPFGFFFVSSLSTRRKTRAVFATIVLSVLVGSA